MPVANEPIYTGEGVLSEANGRMSRDVVTIIGGQNLAAMTVLGKITASGKYTAVAPAAGDGSQTAAAILRGAVDATGGDVTNAVAITREAEVEDQVLANYLALTTPQQAQVVIDLAAKNIIIRKGL